MISCSGIVCQYNFSWWNSATPILVAQYEPSFLTSRSNSMHIFSCICRHFNLPSQLFMLPSFFTWPKHTLIAGWKSYRCCHSASLLLQHQCFGRSWSENIMDRCRGKQKFLVSWKFLLIMHTCHVRCTPLYYMELECHRLVVCVPAQVIIN